MGVHHKMLMRTKSDENSIQIRFVVVSIGTTSIYEIHFIKTATKILFIVLVLPGYTEYGSFRQHFVCASSFRLLNAAYTFL